MKVHSFISESQFCRLAKKYNVIPLCSERFVADSTNPCEAFWNLYASSKDSFLLESVEGEEKVAHYSFIGVGSLVTFTAAGNKITIEYAEPRRTDDFITAKTPLSEMKRLMKQYRVFPAEYLPRFKGGFVGYMSYEMARFFEPTAFQNKAGPKGAFDAHFVFPRHLASFDHRMQTIQIFVFVVIPDGASDMLIRRLYRSHMRSLDVLATSMFSRKLAALPIVSVDVGKISFQSNLSKKGYMQAVQKAKKYIVEGDIIQVVLSQRLSVDFRGDPFTVYRCLRYLNPSPYMYFLRFGGTTIIGASPEMLVRVDGKTVTTCPIAGTRKRGRTDEEEEALEADLLADAKERAEHIMLVDLSRNDVGKIAETGSVNVSRLMAIERFSHVMHMVSEVKGTLRKGEDMFSAFQSCFPAGTVSGAPKIRAMQIIEELEGHSRGIYAGSIGYFSFFEELDSCITIRTIAIEGKKAWVQAGAGIVADSDPEREYEETLNKARASLCALAMAGAKPAIRKKK